MELELTSEQDELRDSVRTVLAKECPPSLPRAVVEEGVPTDRLWSTMVDLGWPALALPEAAGGLGQGFVETMVVAEELGRVLAPGPWLSTVAMYAAAVSECSPEPTDLLAPVAAGASTGTLAITGAAGSFDPARTDVHATPVGDGFRLSGTARYVLGPPEVDEVVVAARLPGTTGVDGLCALRVPITATRVLPRRPIDATRPLADLDLDDVVVEPGAVLGDPGAAGPGLRRAAEQAGVALALELVGTCQAIFDMTLDYAKARKQFGVPIGSFQAVKHKFADMAVALERARATGYFAALTIAEDDPRRGVATSVAKVAAGECQRLVAKEGIQIHAGIGFTWEHDVHLFVKRAKAAEPMFGNAADHRERIATALLGGEG